jgi:Lrp/AsnC family transcriptional regulator
MALDKFDRKILTILQRDGSLSNQALAGQVGLSTTPCWRRVSRLEKEGYIRRNVMLLDAEKLGLDVTAFAQVSLRRHQPESLQEFSAVIGDMPEVLECHALSGQYDFMLKIVCKSIKHYDQLSKRIMHTAIVQHMNSNFVMNTLKCTTRLPIE